jgi:hypothetical protein
VRIGKAKQRGLGGFPHERYPKVYPLGLLQEGAKGKGKRVNYFHNEVRRDEGASPLGYPLRQLT